MKEEDDDEVMMMKTVEKSRRKIEEVKTNTFAIVKFFISNFKEDF